MKKHLYIFLFLLLTVVQACVKDQKDLFDSSPSTRVEETLKAYNNVLKAPQNGWIMHYFPESTQRFGGYVMLMQFKDADSVYITSEVLIKDEVTTLTEKVLSLYSLKSDVGPTLNFDTYNAKLHYFSDPDNNVGDGKGSAYLGDFEFLFKEVTPDRIVLKGKKTGNRIVMTPMPVGKTWASYIEEVDSIAQKLASFDLSVVGANNADKIQVDRQTDRSAILSYGKGTTEKLSFMITNTGIELYDPLSLGGNPVRNFVYNKDLGENGAFASTEAGSNVKIYFQTPKGYLKYEDYLGTWIMNFNDSIITTSNIQNMSRYISFEPLVAGKTFKVRGIGDLGFTPVIKYNPRGGLEILSQYVGPYQDMFVFLGFLNDSGGGSWHNSIGMKANWDGVSTPIKLAWQHNGSPTINAVGFAYLAFSTNNASQESLLGLIEPTVYRNVEFIKQ